MEGKKSKMKGFDLSSLRTTQEEGAAMELVDLNGHPVLDSEGKKITITVLSIDSAPYKSALREQQSKLLNKKAKRGGGNIDMEVMEGITRKARAKATIGWSGIVLDGKELPCNYENALMVYENLAEVDEQVTEFIADRVNFTKAS